MGKFFFIVLAIGFFIQIMKQSGVKKLSWFFVGILFFPPTVMLMINPPISFSKLVIYCLLLAFIIQNKKLKQNLMEFPIFRPMAVLAVCCLLIGCMDSRLSLFQKLYRPISYFIENFLVAFLTYFYIKTFEDAKRFYHFLIVCMFLFALYGIINYVTKVSLYNSIIAEIYDTIDYGNRYTLIGDARFRITSFAWHAIYYGLLVALSILLMILFYYENKLQFHRRSYYLTGIALLMLNLFWTNSRTPLVAFAVGLSIFYAVGLGLGSKLRLVFIGILTTLIILIVAPDSVKIVDETVKTLTSQDSKIEGSSVEMRDVQLEASLLIFSQNPIFGNGFSYIIEDLGYSSDEKKRSSEGEFYGFESYSYKLLIEQGLMGMIGNLFFFGGLFVYYFRIRKHLDLAGRRMVYISAAMTITFLLFIFGTGDLGSFTFFMSLLGVNIKTIELSKEQIYIDSPSVAVVT
jgi:hypothetical protein